MLKKILIFSTLMLFTAGNAFGIEHMRIRVRTELPKHISTVGGAAQYYADSIGYQLITNYPAPAESAGISAREINLFSRKNKVLPIEEAILNLIEKEINLVIDNRHKLFSFEKRSGK